jgi:hypothetical protein
MTHKAASAFAEMLRLMNLAHNILEYQTPDSQASWTPIDQAKINLYGAIRIAENDLSQAIEVATRPINLCCPKCEEWSPGEHAIFENSSTRCDFCGYGTGGGDDYGVRCSNCDACFGCGIDSNHDRYSDRKLPVEWPYGRYQAYIQSWTFVTK